MRVKERPDTIYSAKKNGSPGDPFKSFIIIIIIRWFLENVSGGSAAATWAFLSVVVVVPVGIFNGVSKWSREKVKELLFFLSIRSARILWLASYDDWGCGLFHFKKTKQKVEDVESKDVCRTHISREESWTKRDVLSIFFRHGDGMILFKLRICLFVFLKLVGLFLWQEKLLMTALFFFKRRQINTDGVWWRHFVGDGYVTDGLIHTYIGQDVTLLLLMSSEGV